MAGTTISPFNITFVHSLKANVMSLNKKPGLLVAG
jgi:hypothetical protein